MQTRIRAPGTQQRAAAVGGKVPWQRPAAAVRRQRLPTRCEAAAGGDAAGEGGARRPTFQTQQLYNLMGQQQRAGSEHGQGFVNMLLSGSTRRVDIEHLNDQMRPAGALRLRHAQHPHEAFGMVFNFDGVVADLHTIRREAWLLLAAERGLPQPSQMVLAHPELHRMPPEVAVVRLLRWANDRKGAVQLAMQHAEIAGQLLATHNRPLEGVREWLDTLGRFNVPCALVSALDRSTVQAALARMTLHDHFQVMVTAEDEPETIAQRLLTASIKLGRPPNQCVFFDSSVEGITAAHNCTFKAVAVQGAAHRHHLKAADITCRSLHELSVINMRRLFANMGSELMDLQKQVASRHDDEDGNDTRRRRRITNATM